MDLLLLVKDYHKNNKSENNEIVCKKLGDETSRKDKRGRDNFESIFWGSFAFWKHVNVTYKCSKIK